MPNLAVHVRPDRIFMKGYSIELLDFYRSLPNAIYHKDDKHWSCLNTDAVILRLLRYGASFVNLGSGDLETVLCRYARNGATRRDVMTQPPTKTPAWRHQVEAFEFAKDKPASMLAMSMGCGKTLVAVALCEYWGADRVLVLSPKSVVAVWGREFSRHAISDWVVVAPKGGVKDKAVACRAAITSSRRKMVFVVNYESAFRSPFREFALETPWDVVICDESHRIKSHSSETSKFAYKLGRVAKRRLCLTGTPMGQSPLDVFGQYRFLDPGVFGTSWTWFSNRYALHNNPAIPQQITGYKNQEELQELVSWLAFRVNSEDVLDLPEVTHNDVRVELGKEAKRIYRELETELAAEVASGVVTVSNALTKLLRLAQCTSGFLVPSDESEEEMALVEFDSSKEEALEELISGIEPSEPVVCFTRFRHDCVVVNRVAERLGRRYCELSGSRKDALNDRAELVDGAQVVGVNIQSGGVGVDLSKARYAIYVSVGFSLTEYDQSLARLHRPGQTRPVVYYHLIADDTIDEYVYRALWKRKQVIESILETLNDRRKSDES